MRRIHHIFFSALIAAVLLLAACGKKGPEPTLPVLPGGEPVTSRAAGETTAALTISPDDPTAAQTTEPTEPPTAASTPSPATQPTTPEETTPEPTEEPSTEGPDESSAEESTSPEETEPATEPASTEPPATQSPEEIALRERAAAYLAQMDTRARLFQLIIVTPEGISWDNPVKLPDNNELRSCPVGGILYQAKNMETPDQLTALVEGHQKVSSVPLLICVDEEGGRVSRIMQTMGTTPIKNMFTYRGDGIEKARTNALTLATDISRFGFNLDFAPVADVWSNPENKVIGERAYSDDFGKAATLIASAVRGFHDGGVICTLKHFPGHGDTVEDSHENTAVVTKTLSELREQEFLPFLSGIAAGADLVMTGHLMVPDVDPDNPATFSRKIVTDLLRKELGFDGVIITDALEMAAAASVSTGGEACLKALNAGCDMLLCPEGQPEKLGQCVDFLAAALESGQLSGARVDESVLRVLMLKLKYGILE
ncbi:MAG: beta-N-acetylhexosaminidase [Lachnospiraceae bacterium]|nr:beta-N-acetylhexosaminidase [Lachnospiraceae bacterium]